MNVALLQKQLNVDPIQSVGVVRAALADVPQNEAVPALLEIAENEEQKRRVLQKIKQILLLLWGVFVVSYLIFDAMNHTGNQRWWGAAATTALFGGPQLTLLLTSPDVRLKRLRNAVVALLQFPNEPRFLLPFVDALNLVQAQDLKGLLYPTLTEKLWNLSATDAALAFHETRRATLRSTLFHVYAIMPNGKRKPRYSDHYTNEVTDLAVALIKTLAQIGDKKSVKVLQRIIKSQATTANENVVIDAAREYLPVLMQKRAENEAVQKQLRTRAWEKIRSPYVAVEEFAGSLSPDEAKVGLVEFLEAEQQGKIAYAGVAVGVGIIGCLLRYAGFQDFAAFLINTIFLLPTVCAFLVVANSKWSREAGVVAYELAKQSETDTRLLPVLLNAARNRLDAKQDDVVKKALVRLLPLVKLGDAALVPPTHRPFLRSWLKKRPRRRGWFGKTRLRFFSTKGISATASQTLTIAAVTSLAAIGDVPALPAAENLARRTAKGSLREKPLHEAAARCVEALRARK